MGRIRLITTAVVATAAIVVAVAPGAAYAYTPAEFGRCVKDAKGESGAGFSDKACTNRVEAGGKYHWVPGPGPNNGFTATTGSVDLYQYSPAVTKAVPVVECSSSRTTGSFTSATTESFSFVLSGCKMASLPCQSAGEAPGVVSFEPIVGLLTVSKFETWGEALVQWDAATGDTLASFECGSTSVQITGGLLHPITRNHMRDSERDRIVVGKEGLDTPDCRETYREPGEPYPGGTCPGPFVSIGGAEAAEGGLKMLGTQTDEERIEADTLLN